MPYSIIKKIKLLDKGSSTYPPTFGVDLEDEKTWGYFKLYRSPLPNIRGEAIRLLDLNGNRKDIIRKTFDFKINCESHYVNGGTTTHETRLLYLPLELVQAYGMDENMAIELLLHEIIYYPQTANEKKLAIYEKLVEGPRDAKPRDDATTLIDEKSVEKSLIAYCTECGIPLGRFKNESDLRIMVADQKKCLECGATFGFLRDGRIWNLRWDYVSADKSSAIKITREGVFLEGQCFDALRLVLDILKNAKKTIIIIDGYVDYTVLDLLSLKEPLVEVKILTYNTSSLFETSAQAFKKQYGGLEIRTSRAFHDRFVFIDDTDFYHFGASLKDLGNRGCMFSRIEEQEVVDALRSKWTQEWAKATRVHK